MKITMKQQIAGGLFGAMLVAIAVSGGHTPKVTSMDVCKMLQDKKLVTGCEDINITTHDHYVPLDQNAKNSTKFHFIGEYADEKGQFKGDNLGEVVLFDDEKLFDEAMNTATQSGFRVFKQTPSSQFIGIIIPWDEHQENGGLGKTAPELLDAITTLIINPGTG